MSGPHDEPRLSRDVAAQRPRQGYGTLQGADRQRAPPATGADRVPVPLQRSQAAPRPRPVRTGSSSRPAAADQPRRASDPPETSPRRAHARVPDRRLTAPGCYKEEQVTATIVYSSPTPSVSPKVAIKDM